MLAKNGEWTSLMSRTWCTSRPLSRKRSAYTHQALYSPFVQPWKLVYLQAIVKETFCLYLPGPIFALPSFSHGSLYPLKRLPYLRGQNFELIPFGAGRRACSGVSLALQVIHLPLASLLHSFEVDTPCNEPVDMTESPGLSNVKATPLEVLLTPRLSPELYEV
ncbi:hypothetical protein PTKIN_Ptkin08bG0173400 [Pterospermum kingtungense]